MKKGKQVARQPITFELEQEIEAVVLAQLGMSNKFIEHETGLTKNQISYRLTKAKVAEGYAPGHTYRSEWRNGTSFANRTVRNLMHRQLVDAAEKRLPPLFEHPTPKMSEKGKRE